MARKLEWQHGGTLYGYDGAWVGSYYMAQRGLWIVTWNSRRIDDRSEHGSRNECIRVLKLRADKVRPASPTTREETDDR